MRCNVITSLGYWICCLGLSSVVGFAEKVMNDTVYIVCTRAGTYSERSRLSTWLFGIAYEQAIKRLERESRLRLDRLSETAISISVRYRDTKNTATRYGLIIRPPCAGL